MAWNIVKRMVGSRAASINYSACGRGATIADINPKLVHASIGVGTVYQKNSRQPRTKKIG